MAHKTSYRRHLKNTPWRSLLLRLALFRERLTQRVKSKPDPTSTIVVAGSGRSGTTWLANLIAAAPGMQVIFEPMHPHVPQARLSPSICGQTRQTHRPSISLPRCYRAKSAIGGRITSAAGCSPGAGRSN